MAKRALEADPLSVLIDMNVGWTYFSASLVDEAFALADKIIEIEPHFFGSYWLKGATSLGRGEYEQAIEHLTKGVSLGDLFGHLLTSESLLSMLLD